MATRHYLVLLALTGGPLHGYAIKKEVRRISAGASDPGAGSLYRTVRQLDDLGMIEESPARPKVASDDERRVYYRLTDEGRAALEAETARLQRLVATASDMVHGSGT